MSRIPKTILRYDFVLDIQDLITLLSIMAGNKDASKFEPWMYEVIRHVKDGPTKIHWAIFISDKLGEHIQTFQIFGLFFMSLYIIYSYAVRANIQGLNRIGVLGRNPR